MMVSANGQNRRWFNDSHAAVATYTRHPRVTAEYHEACMSASRGQPRRRQPHCKPTGRANAPDDRRRAARGAVIASQRGAHSRDPLARNDVLTRVRGLAAQCARAVDESLAPSRAWGTPDARCTRGLVCTWYWQNAHE